jgi:hypothetical protein
VAYGVSTFYFEEIGKDSTMLTPKPQWKDILVQNTAGVLHLGYRSGFILGGSTNCPSPFMMAQSVNLAGTTPKQDIHLEMTTHKIIISPQQVDNNHFIAVCLVHCDFIMKEVSVHNRQLFDRQLIKFVVCCTGFQAHFVCHCHGLIAENKQWQ